MQSLHHVDLSSGSWCRKGVSDGKRSIKLTQASARTAEPAAFGLLLSSLSPPSLISTGLRRDYKARQGCVWEGSWAVVTNVGKQTQVFRRSFQGWGLRYKGLLMAPGTLLPAGPLSSLKQPITLKGPSLSLINTMAPLLALLQLF